MIAETEQTAGDRLPIGGSLLQSRLAEAAIELFYAQGAVATTVREITAACGLSGGALYNHFASKEELLYVLVRDIHLRVDSQLADVLAGAGDDPAANLAAAVRFLVAQTAGLRKQSRVANREFASLTGDQRQEVRVIRRQLRDRLTDILLAGAGQGTFTLTGGADRGAATLTAGVISTMCVHISEWTQENYPLSLTDLQDRFVLMALRLAGALPSEPTGLAGAARPD
jgi:TetR/AcrR family transcriptional regulator, cholesterol catabolism regulator